MAEPPIYFDEIIVGNLLVNETVEATDIKVGNVYADTVSATTAVSAPAGAFTALAAETVVATEVKADIFTKTLLTHKVWTVSPPGGGGDATTIKGAIDKAVAAGVPATVRVFPGTYAEASPVVVPSGVTVIGDSSEWSVLEYDGSSPIAGNAFLLDPGARLERMHVTGFSQSAGVFFEGKSSADRASVRDVRVTNCGTGLQTAGGGTVLVEGFRVQIQASSGTRRGFHVSGDATLEFIGGGGFVESLGGGVTSVGLDLQGAAPSAPTVTGKNLDCRACTVGIQVNGTGVFTLGGPTVTACDTGFLVGSTADGSTVETQNFDIRDSATYDISIEENSAGPLRFLHGRATRPKINNPNNLDVFFVAGSTEGGDEGLSIRGELHVGTHLQPKESVFGGGDSYTKGMVVLNSPNQEVGPFTVVGGAGDVSTQFSLFLGETPNNAAYIGGPIPFGGVKMLVDTPLDPGERSLIEVAYWDGSAWVEYRMMSTKSGAPYTSYADAFLEQAQSLQVRLGVDRNSPGGSWTPRSLGGSDDLYWVRILVTSTIAVNPVLRQFKLHSERFEINSDGSIEYFGGAVTPLFWDLNIARPSGIASPANQDVFLSDSLDVGRVENEFQAGADDRTGLNFYLPPGIDTSKGIRIKLGWIGSIGDDTKNIRWIFRSGGLTREPRSSLRPARPPLTPMNKA